jgi:hypothetical protein
MAEAPLRILPVTLGLAPVAVHTVPVGATNYALLRKGWICNINPKLEEITVTWGIGTSVPATRDLGLVSGARMGYLMKIPAGRSLPLDLDLVPMLGHASTPDILWAMCSVASGATFFLGGVAGPCSSFAVALASVTHSSSVMSRPAPVPTVML